MGNRDDVVRTLRRRNEAEGVWNHDGTFGQRATTPSNVHPSATDSEATAELRRAVEDGGDMPWGMVGIKWSTAKRLLEMLDER